MWSVDDDRAHERRFSVANDKQSSGNGNNNSNQNGNGAIKSRWRSSSWNKEISPMERTIARQIFRAQSMKRETCDRRNNAAALSCAHSEWSGVCWNPILCFHFLKCLFLRFFLFCWFYLRWNDFMKFHSFVSRTFEKSFFLFFRGLQWTQKIY